MSKPEVINMKKTAVFILAMALILVNATPEYANWEYSEESKRLGRVADAIRKGMGCFDVCGALYRWMSV